MKKSILKLGKALTKLDQKLIKGGTDPIAGFPGGGGNGTGSGDSSRCFCLIQKFGGFYPVYVDCNDKCTDGSDPLSN
ncbi:hypothetical protein [Aquimarina sp. LLG6339-5]|uniref:hypothetical protein n=1 Tax=Aquimarina sp. LLG6339-5 TaxID=3160830 RepID=UPI00386B57BC